MRKRIPRRRWRHLHYREAEIRQYQSVLRLRTDNGHKRDYKKSLPVEAACASVCLRLSIFVAIVIPTPEAIAVDRVLRPPQMSNVDSNVSNYSIEQSELQSVLKLLRDSQCGSTEVHRSVHKQFETLCGNPKFSYYLVHVMVQMSDIDCDTRAVAGLILKRNIRQHWDSFSSSLRSYIREQCLKAIADPNKIIVSAAGVLIAAIVACEKLACWPDLIKHMLNTLNTGSVEIITAAFTVLEKICEDSVDYAETDRIDVIDALLPNILPFVQHSEVSLRERSLRCINNFLSFPTPMIQLYMTDQFLECIFSRANDPEPSVQKELCRALTYMLESHVDKIAPSLPQIVSYMIQKTQDEDEDIALEACEFWFNFTEAPNYCKAVLLPRLSEIVPALVRCMRYTDEDLALLKCHLECDQNVPDREEDIRPPVRRGKPLHGGTGEDDEDFALIEEALDDDYSSGWNIRKCAAASLDVFASLFGRDLLPTIIPILDSGLRHEDWLVKEATILALGAIAEGCTNSLAPHLPTLVPYLIECMNDQLVLIRSICCWTLSRYCYWVIQNPQEDVFEPLLRQLLVRILDPNKKVQEAACSALATLEEEACMNLVPYLDEIVQALCAAGRKYQAKNILILYDAIGTLADSVGNYMNNPDYISALMPMLIEKWNALKENDREVFSLLECFSSLVIAMQNGFLAYGEPVFSRCVKMIEDNMPEKTMPATTTTEGVEWIDRDFLIIALDLLSSLVEGLGSALQELAGKMNVVALLYHTVQDVSPEVRQSSFALLGDLAKACWPLIKPHSDFFLLAISHNINPELVSVCNNAVWALGEMTVHLGTDLKPYIKAFVGPLLQIMGTADMSKTLIENAAIAVGRFGLQNSDEVAPYVSDLLRHWCITMRNIRDNEEKESSFRGLCNVIMANPTAALNDLVFFCDAISSWSTLKPELRELFVKILFAFKQEVGDAAWQEFTSGFPPLLRQRLGQLYGL
uniref:Transportin-1 n=1 Tax=Trichuris muris TaxID=70415 RepID=A0A5S6Q7W0_TRIMR